MEQKPKGRATRAFLLAGFMGTKRARLHAKGNAQLSGKKNGMIMVG